MTNKQMAMIVAGRCPFCDIKVRYVKMNGDVIFDANVPCLQKKNDLAVDPGRRGKWVEGLPVTCSVCGKAALKAEGTYSYYLTPFCPQCGSKMEVSDGEVD